MATVNEYLVSLAYASDAPSASAFETLTDIANGVADPIVADVAILAATADVSETLTAEDFPTLAGVATVTEELASGRTQSFEFSATVSEEMSIIWGIEHTEVVTATEELSYFISQDVTETATATELMMVQWTTSLFPRGGEGTEELSYFFSASLAETATATEVLVSYAAESLTNVATATELLTPVAVRTIELTTTAEASGDAILARGGATLVDVATATEVLSTTNAPNEVLTDSATAVDTSASTVAQFEQLLSSATGAELITFDGSIYHTTLTDTAEVTGTLLSPDLSAIAWVMNTETTGLSHYDNFDFTSITEHNGVLYATSNAGVYKLTGDDDAGRAIDAEVVTGFLGFKTEQTKRLSDLYVGLTGSQLEVDVETYGLPREVYTYLIEDREADAPRNNRVKVGKGIRSRYWRFTFRNVDGADFQIHDLSAVVGISNRRL